MIQNEMQKRNSIHKFNDYEEKSEENLKNIKNTLNSNFTGEK